MMPQHFQLLDRYHEELIEMRLGASTSFGWGVSELEVDLEELARGIFQVKRLTAVMPDGLFIRFGGEGAPKGLVTLSSGDLQKSDGNLEIYLAVVDRDFGGVAVDDKSTRSARYRLRVIPSRDQFGDAADVEVECLVPNVQLLLGDESRQNFVAIKVAEITFDQSGQLTLCRDYIPPCLKIKASAFLTERLGQLVAAVGAKQKNLVSRYGQRAAAMVEFGTADVASFFYLHTLNYWLPIFLHFSDSGEVPPEPLYLALSSFAGQLCSFEVTAEPVSLPRFQFLDLRATFTPLFEHIFSLLGTDISSRFKTIPLEQPQSGLYVAKIADPQLLRTHRLFLVVGGDVPEDTLRGNVPRYLKIGSIEQISQIVNSALPGVGARVDLSPPSAIPVRAHMVYIAVEQEGRYWDDVVQTSTIAFYQPVSPEKVSLELLAVEA